MARQTKKRPEESAGIDKVESFVQSYFRQLIFGLAAVVVVFLAGYAGFSIYENSKMKKADLISEAEAGLNTPQGVEKFQSLAAEVPFLKNYIALRAAEAWMALKNPEAAAKALEGAGGEYKELIDGLAFDLGKNVDIAPFLKSGMMKPLWYYRLVLTSKPEERQTDLDFFKSLYSDSKLAQLLENWGM